MKKGLLLTCLFALVAAFGMAQTNTWPITLTKANGLPGVKGPKNYTYNSPKFSFDEAVSVLRLTVCATTRTDANTTAFDGYSSGWGPGNAFFELGELKVLDGNGNSVDYVATTNALNGWDGSAAGTTDALNDGSFGTWFRTTWYTGTCPQDYHHVELELASPVSVFSLEWLTSTNFLNEPTYVGITPGTPYYPYPEQNFQLGEKVTDVATLAEGGLFVIRDNAPEYWYGYNPDAEDNDPYKRGGKTPNKAFYHAPNGGNLTANASSVVYLKPTAEENTYQVTWLNSGKVIAKQSSSAWVPWSDNPADAASILFTPCEESEGDFVLTVNNGDFIYLCDALGKMACTNNVDTIIAKRSRPCATYFSLYKASVDVAPVVAVLQQAIDQAQARVDLYGLNETEDNGEYAAVTEAIATGKALVSNAAATPAEIIAARNSIIDVLPAYVALAIYESTDSLQTIIDAIQDEEILVSSAPNWIEGSYPEGSDDALRVAMDEAFAIIDANPSIAQVDAAIASVNAAIARFWASKITGVKSIPFRVGQPEDGLPGSFESSTGYKWESPVYLLTEEISSFRYTVLATNTNAKFGDYPFPTLAEFQIYDLQGNQIELTEESFTTNSVDPADGQGLAGLCDNDPGTYYHGCYSASESHNPNGFEGKVPVYIEVTLPEPVSGFRFVQYGRVYGGTTRVNTPTDFVFGEAGVDVLPGDVMFPDPYKAVIGEKVTDVSQITDDGIYAIQGLISCDPVNHFENDLREPCFFSGITQYGKELQSPCAFSIMKSGEGTYNIMSLADGKYWSSEIEDDGWGSAAATYYQDLAADVRIEPMGNDGLPNSFVLYMVKDSLMRDGILRPNVIFQDWGDGVGTFSVDELANNDKDGEGEWYIYKMTMDNAYVYWLTNLVAVAEGLGLEYRPDPGYYKDLGTFPTTLAAAQKALETGDNETCKALVMNLSKAIADVKNATPNPMIAGEFVIESGYGEFFKQQGVNKVIFTYYNDLADDYIDSDYKMYWGDAPAGDYKKASDAYKFVFESAKESDAVQIMLDDSIITPEQAENAYFIKSKAFGCYIGGQEAVSKAIGTTVEPEVVYIVRQQLPTIYDIWNPAGANFSLHCEWNSAGAGTGNDIVYWSGSSEASFWRLRLLDNGTSISDVVVDEEGDEVVSVTYYTAAGAASDVPVQGVNIVKTVYANGVVKSKKILVK